ncbi:hypothetical protein KAT92_02770 [Candidatus Babeliales bacterium]|nr:hypothetical protein [Candidatus Babeliales bacterium]
MKKELVAFAGCRFTLEWYFDEKEKAGAISAKRSYKKRCKEESYYE